MTAISAIDIAIWDLMGKLVGKSVFKLLGRRTKEKIPVYYSNLYADGIEARPRRPPATAIRLSNPALGSGRKMEWLGCAKTLGGSRRCTRSWVMTSILCWNATWADPSITPSGCCRSPQTMEPRWPEEPVVADDVAGYAELNAMNIVPISGGEHEFSVMGCNKLIQRKAVSVLQYDTTRVGGIIAAQKINAIAGARRSRSFRMPGRCTAIT